MWLFLLFLAVPLTMALMIALEASPQTRPIAILLGPALTEQPESDEDTRSAESVSEQGPG